MRPTKTTSQEHAKEGRPGVDPGRLTASQVAATMFSAAGDFVKQQVDELREEVRARPLQALATAVAFGFVGGRMFMGAKAATRIGGKALSMAALYWAKRVTSPAGNVVEEKRPLEKLPEAKLTADTNLVH